MATSCADPPVLTEQEELQRRANQVTDEVITSPDKCSVDYNDHLCLVDYWCTHHCVLILFFLLFLNDL